MNTLPTSPRTRSESFADGLTVRFNEQGSGRPMLVLHGGGGTQTVLGLASAVSQARARCDADSPWLCGRATS